MKVSERFQSSWFRANPDLKDAAGNYVQKTFTVTDVRDHTYPDGKTAAVLTFKEYQKELGLNKTNEVSIALMSGIEEEAEWVGLRITLFMLMDKNTQGQVVPCVRIQSVEETAVATVPAIFVPALTAQEKASQEAAEELIQKVTTEVTSVNKIEKNNRPFWVVGTTSDKFGTYVEAQGKMAASCIEDKTQVEISYSTTGVNKFIVSINAVGVVADAGADIPF